MLVEVNEFLFVLPVLLRRVSLHPLKSGDSFFCPPCVAAPVLREKLASFFAMMCLIGFPYFRFEDYQGTGVGSLYC